MAQGGGRSKGRGSGYGDDDDDSDFEYGATSKKKASKAKPVPASAPPTRAPVPELVLCSSGRKVGRSALCCCLSSFLVSGFGVFWEERSVGFLCCVLSRLVAYFGHPGVFGFGGGKVRLVWQGGAKNE